MKTARLPFQPKKIIKFDHPNRQKETLFRILVFIIFLIILAGTFSPLMVKTGLLIKNGLTNLASNLRIVKGTPVQPVSTSFEQQVLNKLDKSIFEAKEWHRVDGYLEIISNQGIVALFSPTKDLDSQVSSLQTLLVKSRIEAKPIKKVDLRFNKLFVEY